MNNIETFKKEFDGFTVSLHLDEDNDWIAHFQELPNVSAFGKTSDEAIKELSIAWKLMKESYEKRGESFPVSPTRKDYNGRISLRLDKRLHCALATEAAQAGISLNSLVAHKLSRNVSLRVFEDM